MTLLVDYKENHIEYSFASDMDRDKLKLLVILSPIFIASFDNGSRELSYLKDTIEESKFAYGLYPHFFDGFSIDSYKKAYENYEVKEDIYLDSENLIVFRINSMEEKFAQALATMIESLIIDDGSRKYFLDYFAKIRDDIVINGRRSILANCIQGFYLSKYVVVWMLDLCSYIRDNFPDKYNSILPINELANNLKTPRQIRSDYGF